MMLILKCSLRDSKYLTFPRCRLSAEGMRHLVSAFQGTNIRVEHVSSLSKADRTAVQQSAKQHKTLLQWSFLLCGQQFKSI